MTCHSLDLEIKQGKTFRLVLNWGTGPILFVPITGIDRVAPARIEVIAHGLVQGWSVAVVSVKGMTEINAKNDPPAGFEHHSVTVVDPDTVLLNGVDASPFSAYKSGGYLRTATPVDLTGYTARMMVKDRVGGTEILSLASPADIVIDDATKSIVITIAADVTAALDFLTAVYDLEMEHPDGVVTELASGSVKLTKEVTV